ncbi:hypothetical protein [Dongia sp. agr-C8]
MSASDTKRTWRRWSAALRNVSRLEERMTLKELRAQLASEVGVKLKDFGFRKRDRSYFRKMEGGRQAFYLAYINHETDFDVTATLAIRFDAVENLVHADAPNKDTSTMGVEIGNLTQGAQKRWTIEVIEDVPIVAESIFEDFKRFGLPYYEKFSDPRAAFAALSPTNRSAWMHFPLHNYRAMSTIALAVILKMNGKIEDLIDEQERYLVSLNDPMIEVFRRFADRYR